MPTTRIGDLTMYYEVHGRGEPLLLVMGLGGHVLDWGVAVPGRLAERHQVIMFDNRGAGRTDQPGGPYDMAKMAAEAAALLDALEIERAHVFGVSMGGMIAQHLALDFPQRLRHLVLGCTMPGGLHSIPAAPEIMAFLRPRPNAAAFELAWEGLVTSYTPEFIAGNRELLEQKIRWNLTHPSQAHAFEAQLAAITQTHDTYARLPQIAAPTLVLAGTRDVLVPPGNSHILAERIPGAQLREIDGAGHAFWISHPDETVAALREFLP